MTRLIAFHSYKDHPRLCKDYRKLSTEEIELCTKFIIKNGALNYNDFSQATNRWFLDIGNKPKNFGIMWALVYQANQLANE